MLTSRVLNTPTYTDEELALQTRFYVSVRRASGRVIDMVWFRQNKEYARAMLDFADNIADREVRDASRSLRLQHTYRK
jgi:hypothetical protein